MPSSNANQYLFSFLFFGVALAAFNVFQWSQPPSLLAGISPRFSSSRNIASVEDNTVLVKPKNIRVLSYDCTNPSELRTPASEVRLALKNCNVRNKSQIFNTKNKFQATLFKEQNFYVTDYIPLADKNNTIEIAPGSSNAHKVVVHRTSHDAR